MLGQQLLLGGNRAVQVRKKHPTILTPDPPKNTMLSQQISVWLFSRGTRVRTPWRDRETSADMEHLKHHGVMGESKRALELVKGVDTMDTIHSFANTWHHVNQL